MKLQIFACAATALGLTAIGTEAYAISCPSGYHIVMPYGQRPVCKPNAQGSPYVYRPAPRRSGISGSSGRGGYTSPRVKSAF